MGKKVKPRKNQFESVKWGGKQNFIKSASKGTRGKKKRNTKVKE